MVRSGEYRTLSTRNATLSTYMAHTWDSIKGTLSTHIEQVWGLLVLTGHYHSLQLPDVSTQGNHMGFSECSHGITKIGTLSTHMVHFEYSHGVQ